MMRKHKLYALITGISMMLLIFYSRQALAGAKDGIELCVMTVLPSLFPFFVLCTIFTSHLGELDFAFSRYLSYIMCIPDNAAPVLIPAILGGYPVGAKGVADLHRNGLIEKKQAEKLLAFCSNAGPSFLFGMVSNFFPGRIFVWKLWAIHIMGAIFTSHIIAALPGENSERVVQKDSAAKSDPMLSALKAAAIVCGWVVLFRTLIAFLHDWILWRLPQWLQVSVVGFLELTNGCSELLQIYDTDLRFMICSGLLAFGGICVFMQTASVAHGLSLRYYFIGKSIQTVFSLLMSYIFVSESILMYAVGAVVAVIAVRMKNKCGNLKTYPV